MEWFELIIKGKVLSDAQGIKLLICARMRGGLCGGLYGVILCKLWPTVVYFAINVGWKKKDSASQKSKLMQ